MIMLSGYFMEGVMLRMGFISSFVSCIMHCVILVTYSILINGCSFGFIKSQCGLRQGDPFSLYLFLLCTEGLSSLIRKYVLAGSISGFRLSLRAHLVFHLSFTYDSLLFAKAFVDEAT